MGIFFFIVSLAAAPLVLLVGVLSSPAGVGFLWLAAAFALLLLLAVGANRFSEKRRTGWFVSLAAMVVALLAVGLVSPGASALLVWPIVVAAAVAIVAAVTDAVRLHRHA